MDRGDESGRLTPGKARGHARIPSRENSQRVSMPRRVTRGPLDVGFEDPLADQRVPSPNPSRSPHIRTAASRTSSQAPPTQAAITSPISPDTPSAISAPELRDFSNLLRPENFHPLPPQDVPTSFQESSYRPSITTPLPNLLRAGQFRAAAHSAAMQLTNATSPTDSATIFSLLYVRLACLTLINLTALAALESKALGDLSSAGYRDPLTDEHLVPWELRVLAVRLQALGFGDWRRGVMGYYELGREAREHIANAMLAEDEKSIWKTRLEELSCRVANALVEMGDLEGAARYLRTLGNEDETVTTTERRSWTALVWLRVGDVAAARRCLESGEDGSSGPLNALCLMADGEYEGAVTQWRDLHKQHPADIMIAQNLAVCLLYTNNIAEARSILESLILGDSQAAYHALLFNLSTLYELCTENSKEKKLHLAEAVAGQKPTEAGWERSVLDFKL